jgi:hypothetical protein
LIGIKVTPRQEDAMAKEPKSDPIAEIEEAQKQLRANIEASKQLVEKTQKLLKEAKGQSPE